MIKTFLAGVAIGIANIIPGLSGATVAISFGVYEKLIEAIATIKTTFIQNLSFLAILGFGIIVGIITFAKGIVFSFEKYELWLVCFFIGLILGGIPAIYQKTNKQFSATNIIPLLIAFGLVLLIGLVDVNNTVNSNDLGLINYLMIVLVGFLGASAMIVPGISGAFIFLVLGYYHVIIEAIANLTDSNLFLESLIILGFLAIGIILGLFSFAKLIKYFLKQYSNQTYFAIFGVIFASIIILFKPLIDIEIVFYQAVIALLLIDLGFFITYLLGGRHD